jgi:hypothetical protein
MMIILHLREREETKLICAVIEKKLEIIAARNEKYSVGAAMDAYQQLPTFNMVDFIFASTLFIDNAGMCEVFLCCKFVMK